MVRSVACLRVQWAIFSPKTNSYGNLGPRFQVSLLLRISEPLPPSSILNQPPDWLKITSAVLNMLMNQFCSLIGPIFQDAILDLENNRIHCSQNTSLLSFSAPDWLKFVAAILDFENNRVYCSRNNSLLSFSAPDWLPVI